MRRLPLPDKELLQPDDLNDTITAVIEYKDGSVIKRGFNIEFDKDGVGSIRAVSYTHLS